MRHDRRIRDGFLRSYAAAFALGQRAIDSLLIGLSLAATVRLAGRPWSDLETIASCTAILVFYFMAELNGLYRSWRGSPAARETGHVLATWAGTIPVLLLLLFAIERGDEFPRSVAVVWILAAPAALAVVRLTVRASLQELRRRGRNSRSVAIFGMTTTARALVEQLEDPTTGLRIVGYYDDRAPARRQDLPAAAGFRGSHEELLRHVRHERIDLVYLALPLRAEDRIRDLIGKLSDTTATVLIVGDFVTLDMLHAQWSMVGDVPVVAVLDTPFCGLGGWLKRLEDILLGASILLLLSLPMAAIAIALKLTSPGPIFFVQRRYGLNGVEIPVIKFRTMTVCEDGGHVRQATLGDSRITRLGAFLRRTSLDELPQFFNVLAGHMSIVGPRPHAVAHNELYRTQVHRYMLRHKVKPGITGWAQVNGWRGETITLDRMEKRIEHDLYYIHNWDLLLDLRIIVLTVFGKKVRRNAY